MTAPSRPLVEVADLVKHFPVRGRGASRGTAVRAVDGVSFTIARGETLALVGESGSGKTTTGRALLRLVEPDAGTIRFDGLDVRALDAAALRRLRRRMQVVFQDPSASLDPRWTVGDLVGEGLAIHGLARGAAARDRVAALLASLGLPDDAIARHPHEFSGGQRQRIALARALAVDPDFLVCDEPVSALDVSVQAQVLNLLRDLQRARGLTYLLIAHDLAIVRHVADRGAVMYHGRLAEVAPARMLFAAPRHPYTQALLAAVPSPVPGAPPRPVLAGEPPSPTQPIAGCPFHPRCPHPAKDEACRTVRPTLVPTGDGHLVACPKPPLPLSA